MQKRLTLSPLIFHYVSLDHSNFKFGLSYCFNKGLDEISNLATSVDQDGL